MTAQPSEKLTKEQVADYLQWRLNGTRPGPLYSLTVQEQRLLAQSWLEQYEALERAAMWLDNDIDWRSPNPNEVKLLAMLQEVLR